MRVTDHVFQACGFGHTNMTLVQGLTGVVVLDPLRSPLSSRAALARYRKHENNEDRVHGIICTRNHPDHYAGMLGVATAAEVESGRTEIVAPAGFYERIKVVSGEIAEAQVLLPTTDIDSEGEELIIDGFQFEFHLADSTSTHVEMNVYFLQFDVLYMAQTGEQAVHDTLIRSGFPRKEMVERARMIEKLLDIYARRVELLLTPQSSQIQGSSAVVHYLEKQRRMLLRLAAELSQTPRE